MKIISALIIFFAFTKLSFADTYEFEGSSKIISNDSIELKKVLKNQLLLMNLHGQIVMVIMVLFYV